MVLPFGLSTAPYIFTKILRLVMTSLREEGCCSVVYLDDFLFIGSSRDECLRNLNLAQGLLPSLGFLINYSNNKSQLEPSRKCKYLGFIFDSVAQSIAIPPTRKHKLFTMLSSFSSKSTC